MAAFAALTLTDAAGTPVNHTYSPKKIEDGIAVWKNTAGGIAVGFPTATLSLREPNKGSRAWKLQAKLVYPVLEVTSPSTSTGIQPAPTKAYDLMCVVEMVLPERASLQERKDILAMARDFFGDAVITAAVHDLDVPY
jgi:hypothetical protein